MKVFLILILLFVGCTQTKEIQIPRTKPDFLDLRDTQKKIEIDLKFESVLTQNELERIPDIKVKVRQEFENSIVHKYTYGLTTSYIATYRNNTEYKTKTEPIFITSGPGSILVTKLTLVNNDIHYYNWGHKYGQQQQATKFIDLKTNNETIILNEHIIKYEIITSKIIKEYSSKEDEEICKKIREHNDIVRKAFWQHIKDNYETLSPKP